MQKPVLLIAAAAFTGGAITTMIAASYLGAPAIPAAPKVIAAAPDLSRAQPTSPASDEPACEERTWPYMQWGCVRKNGRSAEAARPADLIPSIVPVKLPIDVVRLAGPMPSIEPARTIETASAVAPAAAVEPTKLARTVEPIRAPQATEPVRSVEFERSTDAVARQVRVIQIDRAQPDGAGAAKAASVAQSGQAATNAAAGVATTASTVPAPAVATRAVVAVVSGQPAPALPAQPAPTAQQAVAAPSVISVAPAADAAPPPPAVKTAAPAASDEGAKPDRNVSRAKRQLAREIDEAERRARRRQDTTDERDGRSSRRRRYGDWVHPDAPTRTYERRGYVAFDDARSFRRAPYGNRDSVFGWLGSSD